MILLRIWNSNNFICWFWKDGDNHKKNLLIDFVKMVSTKCFLHCLILWRWWPLIVCTYGTSLWYAIYGRTVGLVQIIIVSILWFSSSCSRLLLWLMIITYLIIMLQMMIITFVQNFRSEQEHTDSYSTQNRFSLFSLVVNYLLVDANVLGFVFRSLFLV